MKDGNELKVNVGASSIILILLIFALSAFAVLSIKASNNELKLAKKTADSVLVYYQADSKAELLLAHIDEILKAETDSQCISNLSALEEVTEVGIDAKGNPSLVKYQISMGENTILYVSLDVGKGTKDNQTYDIQTWKMMNIGQTDEMGLENEEDLNLWNGEIAE